MQSCRAYAYARRDAHDFNVINVIIDLFDEKNSKTVARCGYPFTVGVV